MPVALHVLRGLRLRCPGCGKGKLYRSVFRERESCDACHLVYQRDPGDWSGGAEIALILTIVLAVLALFALMRWTTLSPRTTLVVVLGGTLVFFPFFYRHVKGFWLGVLRAWEGPDPQPNPVQDPEWFSRLWDKET